MSSFCLLCGRGNRKKGGEDPSRWTAGICKPSADEVSAGASILDEIAREQRLSLFAPMVR